MSIELGPMPYYEMRKVSKEVALIKGSPTYAST